MTEEEQTQASRPTPNTEVNTGNSSIHNEAQWEYRSLLKVAITVYSLREGFHHIASL